MSSVVHLVLLAGEQLWPNLQAVLYWQREAGPIRRLLLFPASDQSRARAHTERLARLVREGAPETKIEHHLPPERPTDLANWLRKAQADDPDADWVVHVSDPRPLPSWAAMECAGLPRVRVVGRDPAGGIGLVLARESDGTLATTALPELPRTATDEIPVAALIRAQLTEERTPPVVKGEPPAPLPLVRLTEAAVTHRWRWRDAFAAAGEDPGNDSPDALFRRYVGALLLDLGLANVARVAPTGAAGERRPGIVGGFWVNQGGRILVVDARVEPPATAAEGPAKDPDDLAAQLTRAADLGRRWEGLPVEWIFLRPAHRLIPSEQALAAALGIRVLDETTGPDLPTHLARLFEIPAGPAAAEIERLLRNHLAQTGTTRVFAEPDDVLRQQQSAGSDPALVHVDGWLDSLQRARGQNWLLWSHRGRVLVRVPTERRPEASQDWPLLFAAVAGVDREQAVVRTDPANVEIDLPNAAESGPRLAKLLRPFLNSRITFHAARERLAAEARVQNEAARPETPTVARRTAPPAPLPAARPAPAPAPAPVKPKNPSTRSPSPSRRVSLADLDQALDAALGGGQ